MSYQFSFHHKLSFGLTSSCQVSVTVISLVDWYNTHSVILIASAHVCSYPSSTAPSEQPLASHFRTCHFKNLLVKAVEKAMGMALQLHSTPPLQHLLREPSHFLSLPEQFKIPSPSLLLVALLFFSTCNAYPTL